MMSTDPLERSRALWHAMGADDLMTLEEFDAMGHQEYHVDPGGLPVDANGRSLHAYYSYPADDLIIHVYPRHEWESADEMRTEVFSISQVLQ